MHYQPREHYIEVGGERHFLRVAIWYTDADGDPDIIGDFLIHAPTVMQKTFVEDGHGRRQTASGAWRFPLPKIIQGGRWVDAPVDGDPGDPWVIQEQHPGDPFDFIHRVISQMAISYRDRERKGTDFFVEWAYVLDYATDSPIDVFINGLLGKRFEVNA